MVREKPLVNLDDPVLVLRFAAAPARHWQKRKATDLAANLRG
jgi:hypothetical protein